MIVGVTGHRPDKLGGYDDSTTNRLMDLATEYLIDTRPNKVITGMALGWDQAVALACIRNGIPFIAAVPFEGQDKTWPARAKERWRYLKEEATEVVVVSPGQGFSREAMFRRNRYIVDHSDRICALFSGERGGTHDCVYYARHSLKAVDNLWSKWVDSEKQRVRRRMERSFP
jgi:uncharacterized phage-like protein YoqJ